MSTVQELVALLEQTKPPKQLLVYHPKFCAPKYIVDAVTELSGKFHPPPFTSDEWEAIEAAKVLADKRKEQSRMDEVVPNLLIGNKMAAEDTKYLVEQGVTHLLNTASGENMPDGVKSPTCSYSCLPIQVHPDSAELEKMGIKLLNLEVKDKANVEINEHFKV